MRRRLGVVGFIVGVVSILLATIAIASEWDAGRSGSSGPGQALTVAELRAEAAKATGKPGSAPPLCRDEATMAAIKQAGLPVGPCVPVSDEATMAERQAMLDKAAKTNLAGSEEPIEPDETCQTISAKTSGGTIEVNLPCGVKVVDTQAVPQGGRACLQVRTVSATRPEESTVTKTHCAEPGK